MIIAGRRICLEEILRLMHTIRRAHSFLATRLFYPAAAASALAVGLLAARVLMGAHGYTFLVWNLFLAWLPYLAALWAATLAARRPTSARAALLAAAGAFWLLFLPNAPYIMTDFVHLPSMSFVWWYDVGTLLAFAWAGCILGVASLHLMRCLVCERLGAAASWAFVLVAVALSGVGIYMGRFLRWNSWDVLTSPRTLAAELLAVLANPDAYPRLVGVSLMFGCFLLLGYITLDSVRRAR
jgi:uncharacterized membrane protein